MQVGASIIAYFKLIRTAVTSKVTLKTSIFSEDPRHLTESDSIWSIATEWSETVDIR